MKKFLIISLILVTVISAFSASLVDIWFFDTPLEEAFKTIGDGAGVTIIVGPEVKGKVSMNIRGLTVEAAMEVVLYGTPYDFEKVAEGIYVVGALDSGSNIAMYLSRPNVIKLKYITTDHIKDILNQYGERIKYIEGADFVVVYGKDNIADQAIKTIGNLDSIGTGYTFIYNIYTVSQSSFTAIQQLNYFDYPIKYENSLKFLTRNFTRLTQIDKIGFVDLTNIAEFSIKMDYNQMNGKIAINGNNYTISTDIITNDATGLQKASTTQKISSPVYAAYNFGGKFYVATFNLIPKTPVSLTNKMGNYLKIKSGFGYDNNNNLYVIAGTDFLGKDIEVQYNPIKNYFRSLTFKTNIVDNIDGSLEFLYLGNNSSTINVSLMETEVFKPFYINGSFYLGAGLEFKEKEIAPSFNSCGYSANFLWSVFSDVDFLETLDVGIGFNMSYNFNSAYLSMLPQAVMKGNFKLLGINFTLDANVDTNFSYMIKGMANLNF